MGKTIAEGRKAGSGRKKGATSFVTRTLAELSQNFGPSEGIKVSRIQLEKREEGISPEANSNSQLQINVRK